MRAGRGAAEARLEEVRRQLERWRRERRSGRGRIPNELWQAAAEVAEACGVEKTAARLQVNVQRLQQWVDRCEAQIEQLETTAFVELPPLPFGSAPECTLELEDSTGRRLRISLKGQATAQVVPLSQLLWRSES